MIKKILELSALVLFVFNFNSAKADSFFVANKDIYQKENKLISKDYIIPMIYVEEMEYYNGKKSPAYTQKIVRKLALETSVIVVDKKELADYFLVPKLQRSRMEPINKENSRYSIVVTLELWSKGGVLINTEHQNRYIIIKKSQDSQKIAKKLLSKLLEEAVDNFLLKIENHELKIGLNPILNYTKSKKHIIS